jgi:hypothetical protein
MVTMRRHGRSAAKSECLGHFWKAEAGKFSRAPKAELLLVTNPSAILAGEPVWGASGMKVCLLVNFQRPKVKWRRILLTKDKMATDEHG